MNLIIKLDLKLNNIFKTSRLVLKYKFIIILIFVVVFITSTYEERKKERKNMKKMIYFQKNG